MPNDTRPLTIQPTPLTSEMIQLADPRERAMLTGGEHGALDLQRQVHACQDETVRLQHAYNLAVTKLSAHLGQITDGTRLIVP